jgi:hypothetical protein
LHSKQQGQVCKNRCKTEKILILILFSQELTQRSIKRWYEYVDQGDDLDGDNSLPNRRISRNYEEEQGLPLGKFVT